VSVTIYTKPGCPHCAAAKADLEARAVEFEEIDVFTTPGARAKLLELTGGAAIVPVLVDGDDVRVAPSGG